MGAPEVAGGHMSELVHLAEDKERLEQLLWSGAACGGLPSFQVASLRFADAPAGAVAQLVPCGEPTNGCQRLLVLVRSIQHAELRSREQAVLLREGRCTIREKDLDCREAHGRELECALKELHCLYEEERRQQSVGGLSLQEDAGDTGDAPVARDFGDTGDIGDTRTARDSGDSVDVGDASSAIEARDAGDAEAPTANPAVWAQPNEAATANPADAVQPTKAPTVNPARAVPPAGAKQKTSPPRGSVAAADSDCIYRDHAEHGYASVPSDCGVMNTKLPRLSLSGVQPKPSIPSRNSPRVKLTGGRAVTPSNSNRSLPQARATPTPRQRSPTPSSSRPATEASSLRSGLDRLEAKRSQARATPTPRQRFPSPSSSRVVTEASSLRSSLDRVEAKRLRERAASLIQEQAEPCQQGDEVRRQRIEKIDAARQKVRCLRKIDAAPNGGATSSGLSGMPRAGSNGRCRPGPSLSSARRRGHSNDLREAEQPRATVSRSGAALLAGSLRRSTTSLSTPTGSSPRLVGRCLPARQSCSVAAGPTICLQDRH